MGFICEGRYIIEPLVPQDAPKYIDLLLECMSETYDPLIAPGYGAKHRVNREEMLERAAEDFARPDARAFLAYDNPAWEPGVSLSCAVGGQVDWDKPVGLVLSHCHVADWEHKEGIDDPPAGARKLSNLYTLARTHGTGLGSALFEAAIYPEEVAYAWVIAENTHAIAFYERHGFQLEQPVFNALGLWSPAHSQRMSRGF